MVPAIHQCKSENKLVDFKWIRGHNGNMENEVADELAKSAFEPVKQFDSCTSCGRCNQVLHHQNNQICLRNINTDLLTVELLKMKKSMSLK